MSQGEFLTRVAVWITLAGYGVGAAVFKTGWLGLFLCAGLVLLWWRNATGKGASLNFSKTGTS